MNWLLPGKFLALVDPMNGLYVCGHSPDFYVDYFWRNNVGTVIRLNNKTYDAAMYVLSFPIAPWHLEGCKSSTAILTITSLVFGRSLAMFLGIKIIKLSNLFDHTSLTLLSNLKIFDPLNSRAKSPRELCSDLLEKICVFQKKSRKNKFCPITPLHRQIIISLVHRNV